MKSMIKIFNVLLIVTMVAVTLMSLTSCESISQRSIIGKWKNNSTVLGVVTETTYEFKEDMTGTRSTLLGIDLEFTYSFEEEKLVITTTVLGITKSDYYDYDVTNDKLVLTDKDGESVEYTACE